MSNTYDEPLVMTYIFPAVSFTGAAGAKGQFCGPRGKRGRVVALGVHLTTATTVAASGLKVGTVADDDAYATCAVPVQAINTVANSMVSLHTNTNLIPANEPVVLTGNGGSTAGAGTVTVAVAWF